MKPETDDYSTCSETYVTARFYHAVESPEVMTAALSLTPSKTQTVGDTFESRGRSRTYKLTGWFLCSEEHVASFDSAKHLHWLLDQLEPKRGELERQRQGGWRMDIACLWDSAHGDGGPTLAPELLQRLAGLGIEVWFDVYFIGAYERAKRVKEKEGMEADE